MKDMEMEKCTTGLLMPTQVQWPASALPSPEDAHLSGHPVKPRLWRSSRWCAVPVYALSLHMYSPTPPSHLLFFFLSSVLERQRKRKEDSLLGECFVADTTPCLHRFFSFFLFNIVSFSFHCGLMYPFSIVAFWHVGHTALSLMFKKKRKREWWVWLTVISSI